MRQILIGLMAALACRSAQVPEPTRRDNPLEPSMRDAYRQIGEQLAVQFRGFRIQVPAALHCFSVGCDSSGTRDTTLLRAMQTGAGAIVVTPATNPPSSSSTRDSTITVAAEPPRIQADTAIVRVRIHYAPHGDRAAFRDDEFRLQRGTGWAIVRHRIVRSS
jgi:hypothetical protein